MKKLVQTIMPVLLLFSLIFTACKKPDFSDINAVDNHGANFSINYKWTPTDPSKKGSGTGDIADGESGKVYQLTPNLQGPGICCNGEWTVLVGTLDGTYEKPEQDKKTGKVTFTPKSKGTYKIKIVYTCPDYKTRYSATITITVK